MQDMWGMQGAWGIQARGAYRRVGHAGHVGHAGRVELTCENSITEISHRFRLISEKKKKK